MAKQAQHRMVTVVQQALLGAIKSREDWEAQRKEDEPPLSDLEVLLENVTEEVRRHGAVVAQLAVHPQTRAELQASLPDAVKRIPAWMEARIFGPPLMTPGLFIRGIAQLMAQQREAFLRVVSEQVLEPEPIEELLADAPVPAGGEEESDREVTQGVSRAMQAHIEALFDIAVDLDARVAGLSGER